MKQSLIAQPFAHTITDILARFEDGKPLSEDQLNFLLSHEGTFNNHALDLVIKYYLRAHANVPQKTVSFTIPKEKLNHIKTHEIHEIIENLLKHNLSHVDLKMSLEQYLQFKAVGLTELEFWHGLQFLSSNTAIHTIPKLIYLRWGKLFCVIRLDSLSNGFILDGNVLMYFEDMEERSLNKCVLDYAKQHSHENPLQAKMALIEMPEETYTSRNLFSTPKLSPYKQTNKEEN